MKVGVFHPTLEMYGGAEFVAVVVANALAQCEYEVELFVNNEIDQYKTEQILGEKVASSVKVVLKPTILEPRGTLDMYSRMLRSLAFKSRCDILVDTYSNFVFPWTDVCYFHFPYLNSYNYRSRFPYLKSARFGQVLNLPYVFFEKNLEKYQTKLLLANSNFTAETIKDFLEIDVEVLYPPVPLTFFRDTSVNLDERGLENLVVTVSRFGPGKGVEVIPHIASLTDKSINFVVIGLLHDKSVLQSVTRSIEKLDLTNRVKVLTNVSRLEVKRILNRAKIYLHTTVGEHFGISIVEGMAMGCLPVVHDSGGVKEFVPNDLRYQKASEAAQKIDKAVHNWSPIKANKMKEIAERFSEENFSRKFVKMFKRYEEQKDLN